VRGQPVVTRPTPGSQSLPSAGMQDTALSPVAPRPSRCPRRERRGDGEAVALEEGEDERHQRDHDQVGNRDQHNPELEILGQSGHTVRLHLPLRGTSTNRASATHLPRSSGLKPTRNATEQFQAAGARPDSPGVPRRAWDAASVAIRRHKHITAAGASISEGYHDGGQAAGSRLRRAGWLKVSSTTCVTLGASEGLYAGVTTATMEREEPSLRLDRDGSCSAAFMLLSSSCDTLRPPRVHSAAAIARVGMREPGFAGQRYDPARDARSRCKG
jgi:hypothetical protein